MGELNVFALAIVKSFGFGFCFTTWDSALVFRIAIPFVSFEVYFRKSSCNEWFKFYNDWGE